jgi:hypothetical protein
MPPVPNSATEYIAAFQRGERFAPPAVGIVTAGRPDGIALRQLAAALAAGTGRERENIVALLLDAAGQAEPRPPAGTAALGNAEVIDLLAGPGLARADGAREAVMDALRKRVAAAELAPHGEAFVRALEAAPSQEAFLLVAKAKPVSLADRVDRLARSPKWDGVMEARVARAALGDRDVERDFLHAADAADAAHNAGALADALPPLGLVGTDRCLRAVAARLRTPLVIDMPGAYQKSVRLDVLQALAYDYPAEPALNPNSINAESDYTAAERFCTRALGVTYEQPVPPFMTFRGDPIRR